MRNLDDLSAALNAVIQQAGRRALVNAQVRSVVDAAASGGAPAVRRVIEGMSTAELQQLQRLLSA